MKNAKVMFKGEEGESSQGNEFVASKGWFEKFANRHNLSLRRKTSMAQKGPEQLVAKLVSYALRERRISKGDGLKMKPFIGFKGAKR
eukprot:gene20594-22625_t